MDLACTTKYTKHTKGNAFEPECARLGRSDVSLAMA